MLGKIVKVRVTNPYGSVNKRYGYKYMLNFGIIESGNQQKNFVQFAYIMGIHHPVRNFDGRVIAVIKRANGKGQTYVVAPKSTRFINNDIREAIDFAEAKRNITLECFYESSCGAVVVNDENKYLLIRNKRSAHWGFPKGHIEAGETKEETAKREVLEETGINIDLVDGFEEVSEYYIQGKIEKVLTVFLARAKNTDYTMQEAEIAEIGWYDFDDAYRILNYENDKRIIKAAKEYLIK